MHDKVFAYIVQSQHNETLECHAFLCTKRKMVRKTSKHVLQSAGVTRGSHSVSGHHVRGKKKPSAAQCQKNLHIIIEKK